MFTLNSPSATPWQTATSNNPSMSGPSFVRQNTPRCAEVLEAERRRAEAALMRRAVQAVAAAHNEAFRQLGDDAWGLF